jgi:hypothetical protein
MESKFSYFINLLRVSGEEFYMIFCEYDFSNVDDEARYIIIQLRTIIESL